MTKLLSRFFTKYIAIKPHAEFATLPEFPNFKRIELSDKEDIEKITSKYPPYSDFNFVSMWSWDTKNQMRISQLHGNLVVRFTDYITGEPFYSFLGDNKVNETADALLQLSKEEGLEPKLKLVPEIVANLLDSRFKIQEDRDNFDYIYDLKLISEYRGSRFAQKRNKISSFSKRFYNSYIKNLDFKNSLIQQQIAALDGEWLANKIKKDFKYKKMENEFLAIKRFFQSTKEDILGLGIFNEKKLIGYTIIQILPNGYSISHFSKTDTHFNGVYDYFMKEIAQTLRSHNYSFLNYEQDLGIPGLRENKESFMSSFLKKHIVSFAE